MLGYSINLRREPRGIKYFFLVIRNYIKNKLNEYELHKKSQSPKPPAHALGLK
jgi:hypothetical protein